MTTNVSNAVAVSEGISFKSSIKNSESIVSTFQSVMSNVGNQNYATQNQGSYLSGSKSEKSDGNIDRTSKTEVSNNRKASNNKVDKNSKSDKPKDLDKLKEKVKKVLDSVKEEIQDRMNISEQDLDNIMEMLGLTDADLLDNQNVLMLVMEQAGVQDNVSLFENQDLVSMLKGLMEQLQDIKNELQGLDTNLTQDDLVQLGEETTIDSLVVTEDSVNSGADGMDRENFTMDDEGVKALLETDDKQFNNASHNASSDEGMMNNSFAASNTVVHNLAQAMLNSQQVSYSSQAQAVDIINQIVEGIKASVKPGTTQVDIQLNPESLGKVNVTLVSKEGMISAQIAAQTEVAKHAIEGQITVLKEAFQNQGLKVEAVEVSVSPQGFDMRQQAGSNEQNHSSSQSQSRRQINLDDLDIYEDDLSEEEEIMIDMMQQSGSSVDFTA